jgi:hypothetical protein
MAAFPGFNTPAYGTISGFLPFGGGGGLPTPDNAAQAYTQAYNSALQMNQANYNNILTGYQQAVQQQTAAQQAIQAGYANLYNQVLNKVEGIGNDRRNQINSAAAKQLASGSQQLIDRGLGNTTIQSSLDRGVESDRNRNLTQLSDDQAKMIGDYMSQLGLAGLGAQQRGLEGTTAMLMNQLGFMGSVQANYPNAGLYASLAMQGGNQNKGYGGGSFGTYGGMGMGGPKLGYVPSGGPYYGPSGSGAFGAMPTGIGNSSLLAAPSVGGGGWNVPSSSWAPAPSYEYSGGADFGPDSGDLNPFWG